MSHKPLVALVGRPNVGKSTLFNRLAGERLAVVDDTPGTTRDRIVAESEWGGRVFDIVDTGGIEAVTRSERRDPLAEGSSQFLSEIRAQAETAINDADVIVFLVDLEAGPTSADEEVATVLRRAQGQRQNPPAILLAANKGDSIERRETAYLFYQLGLGEPMPISAVHGIGTGDLLDAIAEHLKNAPLLTDEPDDSVKVAIVGRPNVGKSSLLNRLLGEERAIVSEIPGTTRDAVDIRLTYDGVLVTLIDTAGIRRRGRIEQGVEKWSVLRSYRAIDRADVGLLLIDATEGITAQDAHVAGFLVDKNKSSVIIVNKWDAVEKDSYTMETFTQNVREKLGFLSYAPLLFISALTGQRVNQVLTTALRVQEERLVRIPTGELNRLVRDAVMRHPPPAHAGKRLKIFYASQVNVNPPVFLFHVNDPELVHFSYERYLENQIREHYTYLGTPIKLSFRPRGGDD